MLKFTEEHEWLRIEGDTAVVGITDFAQRHLGDLVFVELPKIGAAVKKGDPIAVVESVKVASEVYAPADGEIVEVNEEVVREPQLISTDPMGKGWFFKIKLSALAQLESMKTETEYQALINANG